MQPGKPTDLIQQEEPKTSELGADVKQLIQKETRKNQIILGIPFLFLILCFFTLNIDTGLFVLCIIGTVVSGIYTLTKLFTVSKKLTLRYRQTVVHSMLKQQFNQLEYEPNSYLTNKEFWHSGLSEKAPNKYHAEN